jgi:hypothetical protein
MFTPAMKPKRDSGWVKVDSKRWVRIVHCTYKRICTLSVTRLADGWEARMNVGVRHAGYGVYFREHFAQRKTAMLVAEAWYPFTHKPVVPCLYDASVIAD